MPVICAWGTAGLALAATVLVLFVRDLRTGGSKDTKYFDPYNPPVDIEYIK